MDFDEIIVMKNILGLEIVRAIRDMPDEFRVSRVISPESKEAGELFNSMIDDTDDAPDMFYENDKGIYNIIEFESNDNTFDVVYGEGVIADTLRLESDGVYDDDEKSHMDALGKDSLIDREKAKPDFKILDCMIVGDELANDIRVIILSKRSSV